MTQRDNILQELQELKSQLAEWPAKNAYTVPEGYFEGLIDRLLSRIRAMESVDVTEEINHLSILLSNLSRKNIYTVPAGYFESLNERLLSLVQPVSAQDELAALSPFLGNLKKETPYRIPQAYFDNLPEGGQPTSRVVVMRSRSWLRYAAAALITGIIALGSFLYFNQEKEPGGRALAKFTRDIKKMNETQKENLIDFIDAGLNGNETVQVNAANRADVKELLEGISVQELNDFEQQTEDLKDVLIND